MASSLAAWWPFWRGWCLHRPAGDGRLVAFWRGGETFPAFSVATLLHFFRAY